MQITGPLEVGRDCDGLLLADPQTSRRHARLSPRGTEVLVEDLGSTNGTHLDEVAIPVAVLRLGSVIRIGETTIELVEPVESARPSSERGPTDARHTVVATASRDDTVRAASGSAPAAARETSIDAVARAVQHTGPLLERYDYEGTITIVFSDIESSTERALALGDTAWMRLLNTHNEIIRRNVRSAGGHEVKNQGDGFMLTFQGARRALQCMIAVQREFSDMERNSTDGSIRIRVGVHTGEVIEEGGDIFGRHVMIAARVASQADGGEILVSSLVREIASARGDLEFGPARSVTLKGIEGEHLVYPVIWS